VTSLRKQTTLSNGLTIVTETVDTVRSVALGFWVRAGSRYEPESLSGISHFLEHTVFKGTSTRSTFEIASIAKDYGASVYKRPDELAQDRSTVVEVCLNVIDQLTLANKRPEMFSHVRH